MKTIPHSNLILVSINNTYGKASEDVFTTRPQFVRYESDFPCYKNELNNLPRGAPKGCYFKNDLVNNTLSIILNLKASVKKVLSRMTTFIRIIIHSL